MPNLSSVLGVGDGLPSNRVFDIERDKLGYMWLATEQGVARFDGTQVIHFSAHATPDLSLSLKVRDLLFDSSGQLWVAGSQGLEVLKPQSERFEPVIPMDKSSAFNVYSLFESADKVVWVGTKTGLYKALNSALSYVDLKLNTASITPHVLSIVDTEDDTLLLATDTGIMSVEKSTNEVTYLTDESGKIVFADRIWRLTDRSIWLATHGKGLATYDLNNHTVELRYLDQNEFDTVGYVFDLVKSDDHILAASLNTGLLKLNSGDVKTSKGLPPLLTIFQDEQVTAFGSYSEGVTLVSINKRATENSLFAHPSETEQYEINDILAVSDDLWFADQLAGICRYSIEGEFSACLDTEDLSAQALARSPDGSVWASLYKSVVQIDPTSMAIIQQYDLAKSQVPDAIYSIAIQNEDAIWLAHSFDGLTRLNNKTNKVSRFHTGNSALASDEVHDIALFKNTLWVATSSGLQAFDVVSDELLPKNEFELSIQNAVYDLTISPNGDLFVQTNVGLHVFDLNSQLWRTLPDRLSSLTDTSIAFDDTGDVWLANSHGILNWSPYAAQRPIRYFDKGDGLYAQGYLASAGVGLSEQVIFASADGFSILTPSQLTFTDASPKVSEFELTLPNGTTSRYFNQTSLDDLPYDHASMRFVLANTNFSSPSKQRFKYKLVGISNTWVELGEGRTLMIPKLKHGKYQLLLQSTDSDGNWSENTGHFSFVIQTPWYATYWAYFMYFCLIVLILLAIYQVRINALRRIQFALEAEVAAQTKEISQQNTLLTQKSDALALAQAQRTTLLRTLSHELMTPVSLIQGPAEQLVRLQHADERGKMANIVVSNAKRLKILIEQLMQVSNSEKPVSQVDEKLELPTMQFSLSKICVEQVAAFTPLAEKKQISLVANIDKDIEVAAYPDQLEKCVSNLISNAIKYSFTGGEVLIELKVLKDEHTRQCCLRVKDQGIGIDEKEHQAIFTPEYRTQNGRETGVGLGIGLSVVKAVVNELDGEIDVNSALEKGSEFCVTLNTLPNKAHLGLTMSATNTPEQMSEKTLLIVDDTPDMLVLLNSVFEPQYKVMQAVDGVQGVKLATETLPDLVISDVMMPNLDGFGLLSRIKGNELTAHIPVILLTANLNEQKELEGLSRQADDYITKPFSIQALELKVRNVFLHQAANLAKWHARIDNKDIKNSDLPILPKLKFKDEPHIYDFLDKLDKVIHQYYQSPDITVAQLAKEMALSERQLHRKLSAVLSMGANEYLRTYRLYQSVTPLLHGKSVAQVADLVGFNSSSYFSACFKKHYGMTAKTYVQKQRDKHKVEM
ncbi:ATP-binding protein [Pseudoalteromonas umbrosa]|uniref:hybrid sensor histidine kinase/response regulator transcription factor n=1 Tax=Pseudoalteromonas umbrosa TaxID=3048489 RepID=UPI0024C3BBE8|nr:ATP-binding protein [Pseudoalteromonas sp. B95]MDK1285936.1 response regulator [Pseudoalteromonas sp. B95]